MYAILKKLVIFGCDYHTLKRSGENPGCGMGGRLKDVRTVGGVLDLTSLDL